MRHIKDISRLSAVSESSLPSGLESWSPFALRQVGRPSGPVRFAILTHEGVQFLEQLVDSGLPASVFARLPHPNIDRNGSPESGLMRDAHPFREFHSIGERLRLITLVVSCGDLFRLPGKDAFVRLEWRLRNLFGFGTRSRPTLGPLNALDENLRVSLVGFRDPRAAQVDRLVSSALQDGTWLRFG